MRYRFGSKLSDNVVIMMMMTMMVTMMMTRNHDDDDVRLTMAMRSTIHDPSLLHHDGNRQI
jgi:hypothetical protein